MFLDTKKEDVDFMATVLNVGLGVTAQQAICRCVVASVYGDEVEL